ncbi:MAG: energy transducer TonB [Leptospiraceae bacterium]|nr:energy transducer TonB [Leptospiraceae bacterium]
MIAPIKKLSKFTSASLMASVALHASAGTSFYLWVSFGRNAHLHDVELSAAPLVPRQVNHVQSEYVNDDWFLLQKNRKRITSTEQPRDMPREVSQCGGKCPESSTGFGNAIAASDAHRKPRWVGNFITANDYPLIAAQQGKDGRVVLSIIIDEEGRVRDAQLLEGSYDVLNEVALRKVREAVFSPAYDKDGSAVACRVRVPIKFELR